MGDQGAMIIAHDNVRERLSTEQVITYFNKTMAPLNDTGLPTVTFSDSATFHYNGDVIEVTHTPAAHTDGDVFAYFTKANIIAAGDLVFNGIFPFIDTEHGGTIKGKIKAVKTMLDIANDDTIIAPGHGELMSKSDLENYHDMLTTIARAVETGIANGETLEQIIASEPAKRYPGIDTSFISGEAFVTIIYNDIKNEDAYKENAHIH
jgi:cyclase